MLVNAKDYHWWHKMWEIHSKAPKVVVLGIKQLVSFITDKNVIADEGDKIDGISEEWGLGLKNRCRRWVLLDSG